MRSLHFLQDAQPQHSYPSIRPLLRLELGQFPYSSPSMTSSVSLQFTVR
ncbi:MAG: hypothetical protein LBL33_09920 [Tannerella sp.]|nr:hypothetical protein [Tannerella sp.]